MNATGEYPVLDGVVMTGCGDEAPSTLSGEDDRFLLAIAVAIVRRGLETPALLWLDSLRPVSYLGSQAMHFLNPMVQMVVPSDGFERLAGVLEERPHLDRLLRHVEAVVDAQNGARSGDGGDA